MKCLVDRHANVNVQEETEGFTPLLVASKMEQLEMVKYLVEHGNANIHVSQSLVRLLKNTSISACMSTTNMMPPREFHTARSLDTRHFIKRLILEIFHLSIISLPEVRIQTLSLM